MRPNTTEFPVNGIVVGGSAYRADRGLVISMHFEVPEGHTVALLGNNATLRMNDDAERNALFAEAHWSGGLRERGRQSATEPMVGATKVIG